MISDPPSRIAASAYLATRNGPTTFTSSTRRNSASGYSTTGATTPNTPALANATSRPPKCPRQTSTAARTASASVTSATTPTAPSTTGSITSATTTEAPSATIARAVAD